MVKAGDKVRVIKDGYPNGSHHSAEIGSIWLMTKAHEDVVNTDEWSFNLDEIELVKEVESAKPDGWSSEYYQIPEGCKELQDIIRFKNMNFARGNIFKAAFRLGEKAGTSEAYDLRKIIWFARDELKRIGESDV